MEKAQGEETIPVSAELHALEKKRRPAGRPNGANERVNVADSDNSSAVQVQPPDHVWIKMFKSHLLRSLGGLTLAERGAYITLLGFYDPGKPLPSDDNVLARMCAVTLDEWQKIKPAVLELFEVDADGKRHCAWIDRQWADYVRKLPGRHKGGMTRGKQLSAQAAAS